MSNEKLESITLKQKTCIQVDAYTKNIQKNLQNT